MLSSLWNTFTSGDDSASESSTESSQPLQPPAVASLLSSTKSNIAASTAIQVPTSSNNNYNNNTDLPLKKLNYDDITADQLLSSFPPFGTFSGNANGQLVSADELSLGSSTINSGADNNTNNNNVYGSSNANIPSPSSSSAYYNDNSEWENFTPRRHPQHQQPRRVKNVIGGGGGGGGVNSNSRDIHNTIEDDYESVDQLSYMKNMMRTATVTATATMTNNTIAIYDDDELSSIRSSNRDNKQKIIKKNSIEEVYNEINVTNSSAWSDEERDIWSTHDGYVGSASYGYQKKAQTNTNNGKKKKKKRKKAISKRSSNSSLRSRRQPSSSRVKNEENAIINQQQQQYNPHVHNNNNNNNNNNSKQEELLSSIYWNSEFRQKWINSTIQTQATTLSNGNNTNTSNDEIINNSSNKYEKSDTFLDEDFSLIQAKKPSAMKIGKHFTFDFDDEETLTEFSSSGSFDNDAYDDNYASDSDEYHDDKGLCHDDISLSSSTKKLPNDNMNLSNRSMNSNNTSSNQEQLQQQQKQQQDNKIVIKHYHEKSHWMPDQLCKYCYKCGDKFTVFRRRHHCRLCGQVFCNNCSSCFVEIVENHQGDGSTTTSALVTRDDDGMTTRTVSIRTCQLCYDQVSSSGPKGLIWDGSSRQMESISNLGNVDHESKSKNKYDDKFNIVNASISQHLVGFKGGSTITGGGEFNNLKIVKQKLESDLRVKHEELQKSKEEEFLRKQEEENPVGLLSKTISSTLTRRFGRLAESAAREAQIGDTGYNDEETKLIGTGVKNREEEDNQKEKGSLIGKSIRPPSLEREVSDALTEQSLIDEEKALEEASNQLDLIAASHLTRLAKDLIRTDAPLLLKEKQLTGSEGQKQLETYVNKLISLSSRCSSLVSPDVRKGDMLDIRPYCKVKVIPGGVFDDSTFVSGVIFHKNVSHKSMAKEIIDPRLMLLNNSIEYTRENRILTLETLMEQETRYFQILITKISKMRPDILLVKGSVSRKAQELLMETNIVLIQNVKLQLLKRIARQTGATLLSNTEHVMNQFDTSVLGRCRRFRLVSFLDNDIWNNRKDNMSLELRLSKRKDAETIDQFMEHLNDIKHVESQMDEAKLLNHQRQAVLAAGLLGERHHDGSEVVLCGIAKRGVTVTYVMIEGCPSHLGCTVVLRGASRPALKQVKRLFQFLVNVSYNLKLETSYLRSRRGKLPDGYRIPKRPIMSSSLCIDFGYPPQGRKARPWNGGDKDLKQRSVSGKITALDHQSILISSIWMAGKTQCCPAEVKGITYYSEQDVSLGQFLRDSCFNLTHKCQNPACKKSILEHSLSFLHNDGLLNIAVEEMEDPIPYPPRKQNPDSSDGSDNISSLLNSPIATWTYCTPYKSVVTPLTFLDQDTSSFSFGKFLEVFFYNKTVELNTIQHKTSFSMQDSTTLYFGCGNLAARFTYERIRPYSVYLRRNLPFDEDYHKKFTVLELNEIMVSSRDLFEKFHRQVEATAKETRMLFGSPANKPEHLQTVLSQLNEMDREVIRAAGTLRDKIISVINSYNAYSQGKMYTAEGSYSSETFAHFPWHSRRYLFILVSSWNERLSAIGQALAAMKKLADSSQKVTSVGRGDMVQTPIPDSDFDDVKYSMKRLKDLREKYSASLNIEEIDTQSNTHRRQKRQTHDEIEDLEHDEEFNGEGSNDQEELKYNFSEEVDADVLASRQRYSKAGDRKVSRKSPNNNNQQKSKPPRRRSSSRSRPREQSHSSSKRSRSQSPSQVQNKSKSVTAGGAVKSALTRLFNRTSKEHDPHIVDLGVLGLGRSKMEPGVGGVVIPVYDDQPSTIIAHALASADYASQFRRLAKAELRDTDEHRRRNRGDRDSAAVEDFFPGSSNMGSTNRGSLRKGTSSSSLPSLDGKKGIENRMLVRNKTHIKNVFRDYDEKNNQIAKFVCTTFWATQFQAVRQEFLKESSQDAQTLSYNNSTFGTNEIEKNYVKSLSASLNWAVSGGKSGASFSKTSDERFIVKCISRTELQMFLDCAPAYFEYLSKAFFHGLPSMLAKIVGVYEIGYYNRVTGKQSMEQVVVMQNIFQGRKISRVFDLKGKVRGRFAKQSNQSDDKSNKKSKKKGKKKTVASGSDSEFSSDDDVETGVTYRDSDDEEGVAYSVGQDEPSSNGTGTPPEIKPSMSTLLDGDFLEFTGGRPLPLTDRAKTAFHFSVMNDTLFLAFINVLDYSILVGIDEEKNELVVGIIDYMRQYDILKQMERVGKSIPTLVGSEAPTIIQPPLYKQRFINAMERYFITVPNKWTTI